MSFIKLMFLAILLCAAPLAQAQTGIRLGSDIEGVEPPAEWYVMQRGTNKYVAKSTSGWGFLETPPGPYEILIVPRGKGAAQVRFPAVTVINGITTAVDLNSGVRLVSKNDLPTIGVWVVENALTNSLLAQNVDRWGLSLVPPGRHRVKLQAGNEMQMKVFSVPENGVVDLDIADMGVGLVRVQDAKADETLLFGGDGFETILDIEAESYRLDATNPSGWLDLWLEAGPASITRRNGSFAFRHAFDLGAGQLETLAFDMDQIAQVRGYQRLEFEPRATSPNRLTVTSINGDRLLQSAVSPDLTRVMIAPAGARARLRFGQDEQFVGWPGPFDAAGAVSLAVQSPENGEEIAEDQVAVIGHASAVGSAGATRVVIVVDTSHSTAESAGIDLDGDGTQESVFDAQITAIGKLLDELHRVEAESPGAAFEVALVEFGVSASALGAFSSVETPADLEKVKQVADSIAIGGQGSDTFYDRGLDAAVRLLDGDSSGPAVILLLTDGKPSQPGAALDASARVGDRGIILHAIGLGSDFRQSAKIALSFPRNLDNGADTLSLMASVGAPGGRSWAVPNPGDIVGLVPELPVLERADAQIKSVEMSNLDTGQQAEDVKVFQDGAFEGVVPIARDRAINRIEVVASSNAAEAREMILLVSPGVDPDELLAAKSASSELEVRLVNMQASLSEKEAALFQTETAKDELEEKLAAILGDQSEAQVRLAALRTRSNQTQDQLGQCQAAQVTCAADLDNALGALLAPELVSPGLERITVPADILFGFGEAELSAAAADQLLIAAQYINRLHKRSDIRLDGHTDGIGSEDENQSLSLQRANAVRDWFVTNGGLASDRIKTRGLGESSPIAAETRADGSDSPDGRQENRRVEIFLER